MIPATFIFLDRLPLTPNGKVDRRALPDPTSAPATAQPVADGTQARDRAAIEGALVAIWRRLLNIETIGLDDNFFDLGGTSLDIIAAHVAIQDEIDPKIPVVALFANPTIRSLTAYLGTGASSRAMDDLACAPDRGDPIAIVGMSGRFPGADSVSAFWSNINCGIDSITHFTTDSLEDAFTDDERAAGNYVAARPILENVELFDAEFFAMPPREAELADPQHRLFLECAWEAIEDAGYDHSAYPGAIGVFAGCSMPTYFLNNVCAQRQTIEAFTSGYQVDGYPTLLGAGPDFLSTRVSYKLDLRGPSMTVQTACSTSLVAVVQACQALHAGEADMALAGAVSITFPQRRGYFHEEGGMVSADGMCRPFEERSSGTVFGSGAGVVVLKRLSDAIADDDHIYAVITGTALNNDGARKVGYTAPSVERQADVIRAAQRAAGVAPRSIGYVECHGTATPLGDPIEFAGLVTAFGGVTPDKGFCAIGSVKANVGHLDVAAGMAGLIKTALAIETGIVPPLAHFERPNPLIDFENSPFFVNAHPIGWPIAEGPRRAGVSALGVGGTNAHIVLEEAPPATEHQPETARQLVVLSARTQAALGRMRSGLVSHLSAHPELILADVAYTLQVGRRPFEHRLAIACDTLEEAAAALANVEASGPRPTAASKAVPGIAFMFPGQGSQYPGMGAALYRTRPIFKNCIDRCADILLPLLGRDLRDLLYPEASVDRETAADNLKATMFAQPAIFAIEYALATLWLSAGVQPQAMIGHSVGELTAACVAGVFSLEDALNLVATRGRLMQRVPQGAMLAVRLSEVELVKRLDSNLAIAAINARLSCVVAGPHETIAALEKQLESDGISSRQLRTSHAFHSAMMDPVMEPLAAEIEKFRRAAPKIPFISGVTGNWITPEQAVSPEYWARHCREAVRFADSLVRVVEDISPILLEVGPGTALTTFARQGAGAKQAIVSSLAGPETADPARDDFIAAVGQVWQHGIAPDWSALNSGRRRRISLPTYSFDRKRHWIEAPKPINRIENSNVAANIGKADRETCAMTIPEPQISPEPLLAMAAPHGGRATEIQTTILAICEDVSGISMDAAALETTFLELGFDSLLLGQVAQKLKKRFNVKITFRQLLGQQSTVSALTDHLMAMLPPEPAQASQAPVLSHPIALPPEAPATPARANAVVQPQDPVALAQVSGGIVPTPSILERVMHDQLSAMSDLMRHQLAALQSQPSERVPASPPVTTIAAATVQLSKVDKVAPLPPTENGQKDKAPAPAGEMTARERDHIAALTARYIARTSGSKQLTQQYRKVLADPRAASGFRQEWKEMVYPIVCERSEGARLWDVDGNEYIDIVNGYGQTAFGHRPDFVVDAVEAQLKRNFAIGPQSDMAGKVAALFSELTGNERVTFCNTGSEAVMAALRVARTVTGRSRVVMFGGAYHGQFDEVLVKGARRGGDYRTLTTAPGVPDESVSNMTVLDYGSPASLAWIRDNADDLAAVIVEPVQSRHPGLQPKAFLAELREVTEASGTAFIFDEVVTGFRVHPGGMQALFGIRADMATYGKVVGGGMPVGILAGKAAFMDALDGGAWQFGDDSYPEVAPTFFAGTFVRHPLVLAALWAVLTHIQAEGPSLQQRLTEATRMLVEKLNASLERRGLSTRVEMFGSMFYFDLAHENRLASLLYYHMRERGIHIQEGFPCFVTTAHTEADLTRVAAAFDDSLDEMRAAGILAGAETDLPRALAASETLMSEDLLEVGLTEPQTEIWLSSQLGDAASCAFNESVSIVLRGTLDRTALESAVNKVIERHNALRSIFSPSGETVRFAPPDWVTLDYVNLSGPSADADLKALLDREAATSFDLVAGPPFRVQLILMGADHHILVFTAHHIVCDGWSINVIVGEIAALYDAALSQATADLDRPLSFSAYAAAAALKSGDGDEAYWVGKFATPVAPLDLPTDRPRPGVKSFGGATYSGRIDAQTTNEIRRVGAAQRCTLFSTLLTAFEVLVGRLAAQTETVIGIPTAGQSMVEDEILVGHCVNFLPLRIEWRPETSWADLLADTKHAVMELYDHQGYTLGTLVRKLGLARTPDRLPLVNVQFNLEKLAPGMTMRGLSLEVASNPKRHVNFDLFFNITESIDGLRIDCDYSTDLFDERTIARWIDCYHTLLRSLIADPGMLVEEAPLLSDAEREGMCGGANATDVSYPSELGLAGLFERQATETPNAVAARHGTSTLTYAQLDAASNRMAHHILDCVGGSGHLIALHAERSLDMLIALLAVTKAGCAYLPLDPRFPPPRLRLILEDAKIAAIVTDCDDGEGLVPPETKVIRIDREKRTIETAPSVSPHVASSPEDLAYVIYTSGSTGRPKGVEVPQGALVNFLGAMSRRPGLDRRDILLAVTTISFDIAALELFLPLIVGSQVVISDQREVADGYALLARLKEVGATVMQATPTLWAILLEAGFTSWPGLKMLCGGEPLNRTLADRLLAGGGTLWNMYGPTETTIWSAVAQILPDGAPITIGKPIDNTRLYILDSRRQPVPTGIPGELWIAGDGVARGYHRRPELTAERFRPDPFYPHPGTRMYATGDMARRTAAGDIALLGRLDNQIKLRGFRIELGDIEAALSRCPGVTGCAVALREDSPGSQHLVAYYTTDDKRGPAPHALRARLAGDLPDYMVPTGWLRLSALPRTPNGKLDRAQLPAHHQASSAASSEVRTMKPPSTPLESRLAAIWKEVLHRDEVGVEDDLYELGADSIHLFQITARALRQDIALAAHHLVQHRTIAKIALALESAQAPGSKTPRSAGMPKLKKFARTSAAASNGPGAGVA